ncbi:MAG: DUF2786 domain-containing protein [Acidimicrobiales bacterium]|nr:DUF2786 domain-containing protein [Acidimicrobiales bacterium]
MTSSGDRDDEVTRLIERVTGLLGARRANRRDLHTALDALADLDGLDGPGVHRVERAVSRELDEALRSLRGRGWEPAEVIHVAQLEGEARVRRLASAMVQAGDDREAALIAWRGGERLEVGDAVELALHLALAWRRLPALEPLEPLGAPVAGEATATPKLLGTIRGLLAKAESTPYPAEADAFTVKAQELMSRHAIDAALLERHTGRVATGEVRVRRLCIDAPYGDEKADLLATVAWLNEVRVAWQGEVGLATIVGFPDDLDAVELLFTSLLVQATRALNSEENATPQRRAPSFRRAFLLAYADRIGRRLAVTRDEARAAATAAHGAALVPLEDRRREAVRVAMDALFPGSEPTRARLVDASGWAAGRGAADAARLGAHRHR